MTPRKKARDGRPSGLLRNQDAARAKIRAAVKSWIGTTGVTSQRQVIDVGRCTNQLGDDVRVSVRVDVRPVSADEVNPEDFDMPYETVPDGPFVPPGASGVVDVDRMPVGLTMKAVFAELPAGVHLDGYEINKIPGFTLTAHYRDGTTQDLSYFGMPDELLSVAQQIGLTLGGAVEGALCVCRYDGPGQPSFVIPSCPIHGSGR